MSFSVMDLDSNSAHLVAILTGVFLHIAVFSRGEWDLEVPKLCGRFALLEVLSVAAIKLLHEDKSYPLSNAISTVMWLGAYVILGLVGSMAVYRLYFHRLRRFPGPFWAGLSNFYVTSLSVKNLHLNEEVEKLHAQYGDVVRLGPSELSINLPGAIQAIYSTQSPCTKGPWYNVLHPRVALQHTRNNAEHAKRRKVWDRGFSAKALRDYEPRVANYTKQLLSQIETTKGKPINMSEWFNFYSFDVMGDMAFGKSFNMLRDGVTHYFMSCLHEDMKGVGIFGHLMWLFPFFKITPGVNASHLKFWRWVSDQVDERRKTTPDRPDVFSFILEDYDSAPAETKQARLNLDADAALIVIAGSDTTAATLTCLFFHLAIEPQQVDSLRTEVDDYFKDNPSKDNTSVEYMKLSKLKHLDAVINETLRLHPPVPSGVQRMTPPQGVTIGNTFIPGDSIVQVPLHTTFRDSRFFVRPKEFLPERWTTEPELTKDPAAFAPFLIGPHGCIGKQLALMELRHVVAQIVHKYNVELAPDQTPKAFLDSKRDTFTLALGPLNLVFTPRS